MPIALQKALVWLKHYWFIPLVAIAAIVFFIVSRDRKIIDWGRILQESNDAHRAEIDAIDRAHAQEQEANNLAMKRAQDAEAQIREQYAKNERDLDSKKEKRVKDIISQFKDDPQALQSELEKETGIRVVILN